MKKLDPDNEQPQHRRAFRRYYELGKKRSLRRLAHELGRRPATLSRWRQVFRWDERLKQLDAEAEAKRRSAARKEATAPMSRAKDKIAVAVRFLDGLQLLGSPLPEDSEIDETMKLAFLREYWHSAGNVTDACRLAGVARRTYYGWRNEDEAFARAIEMVDDARGDYVEAQLMKRINAGDLSAITFYLRNRRPELWNEARLQKPLILNQIGAQQKIGGDETAASQEIESDEQFIQVLQVATRIPAIRDKLALPDAGAAPGPESGAHAEDAGDSGGNGAHDEAAPVAAAE